MPSQPFTPQRPVRPRFMRAQADAQSLKTSSPAVRLLPAVIVAAVVMLGFRVQVVVKDFANPGGASVELAAASAVAAQSGETPAQQAAAPAAAPAAGAAAPAPAEGAAPAAEAATGTPMPVNFDPSNLTKSEIDTLQRLAERREIITQRERDLEVKEGLLKAAEARIDGKIAQLQDLEKNIQGLMAKYDEQKQQEIDQLVKIYGAMKPKEAARIFENLEMPILVQVIQKMNTTKTAPIMAAMDPRKATALTEELTARKLAPTAAP